MGAIGVKKMKIKKYNIHGLKKSQRQVIMLHV